MAADPFPRAQPETPSHVVTTDGITFQLRTEGELSSEIARVLSEHIAMAATILTEAKLPVSERAQEARSACKKIRATMRLLRPHDKERWKREDRHVRDWMDLLAELRGPDAPERTLEALRQRWGEQVPRNSYEAAQRVLAAGDEATDLASAEPALRRIAREIQGLGRRMENSDQRVAGGFELIAEGFKETYRRARHAYRQSREEPTKANFRRWRERTKTHAHQCRLLRDAWPSVMKKWGQSLKLLGQLLSDEHNLAVLHDRLRAHLSEGRHAQLLPPLLELIDATRSELRTEALALGQRAFAEKPRAITNRLSIWWAAAQNRAQLGNVA